MVGLDVRLEHREDRRSDRRRRRDVILVEIRVGIDHGELAL
jgi:hypothetical protein